MPLPGHRVSATCPPFCGAPPRVGLEGVHSRRMSPENLFPIPQQGQLKLSQVMAEEACSPEQLKDPHSRGYKWQIPNLH
jgi:hypothetical protein